jgi:porin
MGPPPARWGRSLRHILIPSASAALLMLALGDARGGEAASLIGLSAANVTDLLANVQGGVSRQGRVLDKLDLSATFMGDDHGQPGLSAFVDLQATDAAKFSSRVVGDAQTISNIDAPAGGRIMNAWVAQDFGGKGGVKAGIIDLNTEFDVQPTAMLFLNAHHGIGPDFSQSGRNGPSIFPTTGFGVAGWWLPGDHWQFKAGLFEDTPGNPDHHGRTEFSFANDQGVLLTFEAHNRLTPHFSIGGGIWHYTAGWNALDPAVTDRYSGNSGVYAIADGLIYAASDDEKSGLSGWTRLGFADRRINPIDASIGSGFVYTGLFGRQADQAGISLAYVHFDQAARHAAAAGGAALGSSETTLEATYSAVLSQNFILQPDIQYVMSPGANPELSDALVIGTRLITTW